MKLKDMHSRTVIHTSDTRTVLQTPIVCLALLFTLCCSCTASQQTNSQSAATSTPTGMPTAIPINQEGAGQKAAERSGSVEPLPALERGTDAFESVIRLSGGRQFEMQTFEKELTRNEFLVRAEYPRLVGDERPTTQKFNRKVEALVRDEVAPFLANKPDHEKDEHPHWKDTEEYHVVRHKITLASDEVISVFFYVDGYGWGAAHGYHYPRVLNYDLKRSRVLKLADLFKPGSKYLGTLSRICRDDLSRQLGKNFTEIESWADGAAPKPKNYRAWVLTPQGLAIIFKEYQVTSYAGGEPKVLIPYEQLTDIINPQGVLASLTSSD